MTLIENGINRIANRRRRVMRRNHNRYPRPRLSRRHWLKAKIRQQMPRPAVAIAIPIATARTVRQAVVPKEAIQRREGRRSVGRPTLIEKRQMQLRVAQQDERLVECRSRAL